MDAIRYQAIKDMAYAKVQQRLQVTPSITEELVQKFTEWFQGHAAAARLAQQEQASEAASGDQGTV